MRSRGRRDPVIHLSPRHTNTVLKVNVSIGVEGTLHMASFQDVMNLHVIETATQGGSQF